MGAAHGVARRKGLAVLTFAVGLVIGLALGLLAIGFLALDSYDRGRDELVLRRHDFMRSH